MVPVPAASAAVTALAVSGQPTGRFVFEGFLPVNRRSRLERLEELKGEQRTMIFYEAPHKLRMTLDDLIAAFGGQRSITLCRELTKLHETIQKTTLAEAAAWYAENNPRGEYVLVVAGGEKPAPVQWTLEQAVERARQLAEEGQKLSAAAKQAAAESGFSKSEIYRLCLEPEEEDAP